VAELHSVDIGGIKIMKRIIEGMLALGIVSLVLITACKNAEITKDETASFFTSANNLGSDLMQTQTFGVLYDFMSKNPPIVLGEKSFKYKGHEYSLPLKIETRAAKSGIEDFYGTWEWQDNGWVHINPAYPPDGILFQWTFYDTTMTAHQAKVLIDSVATYVCGGFLQYVRGAFWLSYDCRCCFCLFHL